MADKLLPCPFCGGIAVSKALYGGEYIECGTCGCSTKRFIKMNYAIEAWNNRPSPWQTGIPTMEQGTYLIRQDCLYAPHIVCVRKKDGGSLFIEGSNQVIEDGILAWQKIEED